MSKRQATRVGSGVVTRIRLSFVAIRLRSLAVVDPGGEAALRHLPGPPTSHPSTGGSRVPSTPKVMVGTSSSCGVSHLPTRSWEWRGRRRSRAPEGREAPWDAQLQGAGGVRVSEVPRPGTLAQDLLQAEVALTRTALGGEARPRVGCMDRCRGCGFTYDVDEADAASTAIRTGAATLADLVEPGGDVVTRRAAPERWSPLEYACHVRDVLLVQRERVLRARREEAPTCAPMGRDERVAHDGYAEQAPADVARQLRDAALLFGNVLDRLGPDDWDRTVVYNYPERWERSLRWVAVHTVHEVHHHLGDAREPLPA